MAAATPRQRTRSPCSLQPPPLPPYLRAQATYLLTYLLLLTFTYFYLLLHAQATATADGPSAALSSSLLYASQLTFTSIALHYGFLPLQQLRNASAGLDAWSGAVLSTDAALLGDGCGPHATLLLPEQATRPQVTHSAPPVSPSTDARPRALHRLHALGVRLAPPPSPTRARGARLGACLTSFAGPSASGQLCGACAH